MTSDEGFYETFDELALAVLLLEKVQSYQFDASAINIRDYVLASTKSYTENVNDVSWDFELYFKTSPAKRALFVIDISWDISKDKKFFTPEEKTKWVFHPNKVAYIALEQVDSTSCLTSLYVLTWRMWDGISGTETHESFNIFNKVIGNFWNQLIVGWESENETGQKSPSHPRAKGLILNRGSESHENSVDELTHIEKLCLRWVERNELSPYGNMEEFLQYYDEQTERFISTHQFKKALQRAGVKGLIKKSGRRWRPV